MKSTKFPPILGNSRFLLKRESMIMILEKLYSLLDLNSSSLVKILLRMEKRVTNSLLFLVV